MSTGAGPSSAPGTGDLNSGLAVDVTISILEVDVDDVASILCAHHGNDGEGLDVLTADIGHAIGNSRAAATTKVCLLDGVVVRAGRHIAVIVEEGNLGVQVGNPLDASNIKGDAPVVLIKSGSKLNIPT